MAEYIEREDMANAKPTEYKKIKAFNPQIVVEGTADKPYYNISYYDTERKEWVIGYGSYKLEYVQKWLADCFEKVEADVQEITHGKWIKDRNQYTCSECGYYYFANNVKDNFEVCQALEENGQVEKINPKICGCFKDKSKFVELPCKAGDTVWYVNNPTEDFEGDYEGWTFLGCNEKYAFVGCGVDGSFDVNDICDYAYEKFLEYSGEVYCVPIDKLYFSKEEAEKALKEREQE